MVNLTRTYFRTRSLSALALTASLSACVTTTPRPGSQYPDSGTNANRTLEPGPGAPDPTDPFRDAIKRAPTPEDRQVVADDAVAAALAADRPLEAVRWLIEVRQYESSQPYREQLEDRALELVDSELSPIGLRTLLESVNEGHFPHEHLLFKLALLQVHARELGGAETSIRDYLQRYPSGSYAARANQHLQQMAALSRVEPTTVGVLLPLSGPKAAYGRLARQALEMAFAGSNLRAVVKDTKDDEATTALAIESLVLEEGAIAVLGPVFRTESRSAAVMAQRYGIPLLTISAAEEVPSFGPWVFRNGVTNRAQARAIVAHAMDVMDMKSFAILHPRHPYGVELRDLFWDAVTSRGGEIRGIESYPVDATTFSQQVKRLVGRDRPERRGDYLYASRACQEEPDPYRVARCEDKLKKNLKPLIDFDALFIPDYAGSVRMIAAALAAEDIIVEKDERRLRVIQKTLGRTPKVVTLLGASGWNSEKITDSTGRTVENAVFTDGFFSRADEERTARFVQRYRERHGRAPRLYPEALIFDSARILRSVIESQQPATRLGLRDALRAVVDFPGVTGKTSFGGGNDATKSLKILTISDGEIIEVPNPDAMPQQKQSALPASGRSFAAP